MYQNLKDPFKIQKQHLADLLSDYFATVACVVDHNDEKIYIIGGIASEINGKSVAQKKFACYSIFDKEFLFSLKMNLLLCGVRQAEAAMG